ncbi:MAG: aminotransferase class I/II-fold pyridoxal phosphate-dependent enzyme [Patescibacteria group bacterium]|nr:aminotransferase class I/II-fold pyridoxal phosphate-dependent enzyme [Patescibacteria group bacterium]
MFVKDFYQKLDEIISSGTPPRIIESGQGPYLTIDGVRKLNFCSSHYLGFTENQRIKDATIEAIKKYGIGTGYRTLAGTHTIHLELEKAIAQFKGTEDAVVFTSAYLANASAIQTLLGKEDIVISDELNHASIIDAVRLSGVKNKFIYKHTDVKDLELQLKEAEKIAKEPKSDGELPVVLIVTDGVFSMDGDLAPLPAIVELAKKYGALTMVDDAHGEGVLGKGGRGIVDHFGLHNQVDIEVGSLSKAFSSVGGFIAGSKALIGFYKLKARPRLFSIAMSIPDTASSLEAIKILLESDAPVKKLWGNVEYLREEFKKLGFDIGHSESPITPVMMGGENVAKEFSAKLFGEDVFATPIIFPMVSKGKARIRVIPSASHSKEDLDKGIKAFEKIGKELKII